MIAKFDEVNNYRLLEQPFPVEIIEISEYEKFEILPGVDAAVLETPHTDESLAIRIRDADDRTIAYSADTGFSEAVGTFANCTDLFILECTFVCDKPVQKHLELSEAISLIRQAEPKRAMLTHFYPEWDDVNFVEEIGKFDSACEVIEAVDGLCLDI